MRPRVELHFGYRTPGGLASMRAGAAAAGLEETSARDLAVNGIDPDQRGLLLVEGDGETPDALAAQIFSITSGAPNLLVASVVTSPRAEYEVRLRDSGALDVLEAGSDLGPQLARTAAIAQRIVALQAEREQLAGDLAHQDRLAALGLLAAGVSHEINNPCGAIFANIGVVRDDLESVLSRPRFMRGDALDQSAGEWLEALGDCMAAARRIQSVVKTLNVFSRRSDNNQPVPVDLNEEVTAVMRLVGKEVKFQAHIRLELDAQLPQVLAVANSVAQIVTNLVVNALQALESVMAAEPVIVIRTTHDDDNVLLEVSDNGPGMASDVRRRIFDPFFTTKPVGKGTGLGLAITRELVNKAGGEIFVESTPDHGTLFRVVFVVATDLNQRVARPSSMPPASARLRVLLLDDDELLLRSLQRSLAPHFECIAVQSSKDALDALRRDPNVDAIVSDIVMPEMNGMDFFDKLQEFHPALASHTAFLSGGLTALNLRERLTATGRPYMQKPVDAQHLVRVIREIAATPGMPAIPR